MKVNHEQLNGCGMASPSAGSCVWPRISRLPSVLKLLDARTTAAHSATHSEAILCIWPHGLNSIIFPLILYNQFTIATGTPITQLITRPLFLPSVLLEKNRPGNEATLSYIASTLMSIRKNFFICPPDQPDVLQVREGKKCAFHNNSSCNLIGSYSIPELHTELCL